MTVRITIDDQVVTAQLADNPTAQDLAAQLPLTLRIRDFNRLEKVAKLRKAGLMRPAGLAAFESRSEAKSGVYSFEQDEPAKLPRAYEKRLRENAAAWEYWTARPPSYRRTATRWVVNAKREETRERRLDQLIESSAAGLHIPPLRR